MAIVYVWSRMTVDMEGVGVARMVRKTYLGVRGKTQDLWNQTIERQFPNVTTRVSKDVFLLRRRLGS